MTRLKAFFPVENAAIADLLWQGDYDVTDDFLSAELCVFTGGVDLPPSDAGYPNLAMDKARQADPTFLRWIDKSVERTNMERKYYASCVNRGVPVVGICRGAQALWAFNGNKIWQDVNNHTSTHMAYIVPTQTSMDKYDSLSINKRTADKMLVTSTHHQQCDTRTVKTKYIPLVVADEGTTRKNWESTKFTRDPKQPTRHHSMMELESYIIPSTNTFGCQFHPEYLCETTDMRDWFFDNLAVFLYANHIEEEAV